MFCSNCGNELTEGSNFCNACGTKVTNEYVEKRKTTYDGEIHKCPNCGDTIDAYETVCEACGYELRGRKSTSAVHELAMKLERVEELSEKEELIRVFYIPNTKEDIYEFFILATSNIKASSVECKAWTAKLEQAYQKAELSFGGTKEFERFSNLYKKTQITRKLNTTLQTLSKLFKSKVTWFIVAIVFLCVAIFGPHGLIGSVVGRHNEHVEHLETLIVEVEMLIEEGDYDGARIKASQIVDDTDWSTESEKKWDGIRKKLLELIEKKEKEAKKK